MKYTPFLFMLLLCGRLNAQTTGQTQAAPSHNTIQLALLLDVSGSMEGLIDQARAELWTVVNEVAKARKSGINARLEIALYEYGRSSNAASKGYVRKLLDYTSDLDTVSELLFSLRTYGGDEYCGWVIESASEELQWRSNDSVYKTIFIAGNEPFNQGKTDYRTSCKKAAGKGIFINTIHCGDSMTGVREFWLEGARTGRGSYFWINHNASTHNIATPYDSLIGVYNDSLNGTYWSFGSAGLRYKENQSKQDLNASVMSKSVKAQRAVSKTKSVYKNTKWDAVDAAEADTAFVRKTADSELPEQLKGKTLPEKKLALDSAARMRRHFAQKINELNTLRQAYLAANKPVRKEERTLGAALTEAIHRQAGQKGFVFE